MLNWYRNYKYKGATGAGLLIISTILNSIFINPIIMWFCFFSFCYMLTYTFCYIFAGVKNFKEENPVWGTVFQVITIGFLLFAIHAISHFIFNY